MSRINPFHIHFKLLQRFYWRTPLAGDDLHELEAVVIELDLCGVVVLGVDLTSAQGPAVLRL